MEITYSGSSYADTTSLVVSSESVIINSGVYSLKCVALKDYSLHKKLVKTLSTTIDLSLYSSFNGWILSNRTGGNVKISLVNSNGSVIEVTPFIPIINTWYNFTIDVREISSENKNTISRIEIEIINADNENIFYLDNFYASQNSVQISKVVAYAVIIPSDSTLSPTTGTSHIGFGVNK